MRSKLFFIVSALFLLLFIILPTAKAAPDTCNNIPDKDTVISCYRDLEFFDTMWDCTGKTDTQCKNDFSQNLHTNLSKYDWYILSWFNGRSYLYNSIMEIYDLRQSERNKASNQDQILTTPTPTPTLLPTSTPLPTPTLRPDSVFRNDECIDEIVPQAISDKLNCLGTITLLSDCYSGNKIPEDNALWNCQGTNGRVLTEVECRKSFAIRTNNILTDESNGICTEDDILAADAFLKQIGKKTFEDIYQEKIIARGELTITPAAGDVIDDQFVDAIDSTVTEASVLEEGWKAFNCGFSNGAEQGKNACCTNTIEDINPDFSTDDSIIETDDNCNWFSSWLGTCPLPDFTQMATDKFKGYLDDNEVTANLNAFIEKEGNLPKCFVGTCGSDNLCHPEEGSAICDRYVKDPLGAAACEDCMRFNSGDTKKFYTALGCIDTSLDGILTAVFTLGLGIAGTGALFCIIYASFLMQTSQGNPESIQKAQENITSCITGLILIIFSVFILRVIGVDILRIPGFSEQTNTQTVTCNSGQINCIGTSICVDFQDQCPK